MEIPVGKGGPCLGGRSALGRLGDPREVGSDAWAMSNTRSNGQICG